MTDEIEAACAVLESQDVCPCGRGLWDGVEELREAQAAVIAAARNSMLYWLRADELGQQVAEQAAQLAAANAAREQAERDFEDIKEEYVQVIQARNERDALRARVTELEAALRRLLGRKECIFIELNGAGTAPCAKRPAMQPCDVCEARVALESKS